MAKINHSNFIDTINDTFIEAEKRGVMRLSFDDMSWEGDTISVNNKPMVNFGTCGYMGLEQHPKVIENTIRYTQKYGTQFSVSRSYLMDQNSKNLENLLQDVFQGHPCITYSSTTLAHSSVLPIVVGRDDLIILDQQAHLSIQTAAQLMVPKGTTIEIIRHSSMDMLEHKIQKARNKYKKIWYMVDGVYSMHGDVAPIDEINELMRIYPELHLYVDDAHGMSWYGINGSGRIFDKTIRNGRTLYMSTMSKGFGCMGGIAVFPNQEWYEKVVYYGGPLAYSHPVPPPMLGAAIASAEIHLSDEIKTLQKELQSKIKLTNDLLSQTDLPVLSAPDTPIFYIGTGQPKVGYNLNKRILDEGYYVNLGIFPAVPVKNTGLRFTITNNNSFNQITTFIETLSNHYPKALAEEGRTNNDVRKAFKLPLLKKEEPVQEKSKDKVDELQLTIFNTIKDVDPVVWDYCFKDRGNFDWSALLGLEQAFSKNDKKEENWDFFYLIIRDKEDQLVLASYFTVGYFKDDMLYPENISDKIEKQREKDPYLMTSKLILMGSMFTEGNHLYIDTKSEKWEKAISLMCDKLFEIQDAESANGIMLRDFNESAHLISDIFHNKGYFKMFMPTSNIIEDLQSREDYFESLSAKGRRNVRKEVLKFYDEFTFTIEERLTDTEIENLYTLYENVFNRNVAFNIFKYPKKLFTSMSDHPEWEFAVLKQKDDIKSIVCCYKGVNAYFPLVMGIKEEDTEASYYRQALYRLVLSAKERGFDSVHLGFTADIEKKKLGATQKNKIAFVNLKDHFNLEQLELSSNMEIA